MNQRPDLLRGSAGTFFNTSCDRLSPLWLVHRHAADRDRQQHLHHLGNSSRSVQVGGNIAARGFQVAEHWNALAVSPRSRRSSKEHRPRAQLPAGATQHWSEPANRHHHRNRVLKSISGEKIARQGICFSIAAAKTVADSAALVCLFRDPQRPSSTRRAGSDPSLRDRR